LTKIDVEWRGVPELRRKLGPELAGVGARAVLDRASEKIETAARSLAPARMKSMVRREVDRGVVPRTASVRLEGGKRERAIHGPMSGGRERTRPHRPPLSSPELMAWAREHGIPPSAVAASVAKRGTPYKPFLRQALERNQGALQAAVPEAERAMERRFNA